MTDFLVEINRRDWIKLKELYTPDGVKNYIAYTTIDNYIRWLEHDEQDRHIKFFCLNGEFSDGTFVVTDRCSAFADTFNESPDNLYRLVKLLDYSKGYTFLSTRFEIQSTVEQAINDAGVKLVINAVTSLYYCPKELALTFDAQPPEGIQLKPVTTKADITKVESVWPHRSPNSLEFLELLARYNVNVGAYKGDGTLVAWLFRLPTGLLGALQTDDKYLGNGYGTLVVKYVSKKIAEMGHDIYAGIIESNHPSRALFGKLGFKSIGQVHWITTKINWTPADE